MSNALSFMTPTTTSSTSPLAKALEPVEHAVEAVTIEQLEKSEIITKELIPAIKEEVWRESVKHVMKTHYKTLKALKNK